MERNSDLCSSSGTAVLQAMVTAACLGVLALRATTIEAAVAPPVGASYSLAVSMVLLAAAAVFLLARLFTGGICRNGLGVEKGLAIFCVAGILSFFAASDKRLAVNDFINLAAPPVAAAVLFQALDGRGRARLILAALAALALASAFQCSEQFFTANRATLEQYELDPHPILEEVNIAPGTFEHMLFDHRIRSQDVNAFFTTGNSAGSFLILGGFAAAALLLGASASKNSGRAAGILVLAAASSLCAIAAGAALTRSKGALAAVGTVLFLAAVIRTGQSRIAWRRAAVAAVLIALAAGAACLWAMATGRIGGGNSILVRWQYWQGMARMFIEHPLAGVGGGNFGIFYPRYKLPGAIESVSDPHNFLLTILSCYGPLGLAGFLMMVSGPLLRIFGGRSQRGETASSNNKRGSIALVCLPAAVVLLLRPLLYHVPIEAENTAAAFVYLHAVPAAIIFAGMFIFTRLGGMASATAAAMGCVAVLLHGLVDFAILEPPVYTAFWFSLAAAAALCRRGEAAAVFQPRRQVVRAVSVAVIVLAASYVNFALLPVFRAERLLAGAERLAGGGETTGAVQLLDRAASADTLSPRAPSMKGRLLLGIAGSEKDGPRRLELLANSEAALLEAARRNPAGYRSYELLAMVRAALWNARGRTPGGPSLAGAFESASAAIERYGGCGRLHLARARIAEKLGRLDEALAGYRRAVEIEDEYRRIFRRMYPSRPVFSRIGREDYDFALERINVLGPQAGQQP